MNSLLTGDSSGKVPRGRNPKECLPLDIHGMINQALDEMHAAHSPGECWCADGDSSAPVKKESERRLQFKDRRLR